MLPMKDANINDLATLDADIGNIRSALVRIRGHNNGHISYRVWCKASTPLLRVELWHMLHIVWPTTKI